MSEILTIDTATNTVVEGSIQPLSIYDDKFFMLREKMPEYKHFLPNEDMTKLVKRMKLTMKLYNGLGLSANQCGYRVRLFVIGYDDESFACINPEVLVESETREKSNEGCLSFPGMFLSIERPKSIQVQFTTETGEKKQMFMEGLTARCFLHEMDHMNGKLFTDYVGPVSLKMARQRQMKFIKKIKRSAK